MAEKTACQTFFPQLSPFIDGELLPEARVTVERHLSACRDCTGRVADLRAESGLIRIGLEMAADQADFKDFAQKVMARVTPEKAPLWERLSLSLSELFTYHRPVMVSSFVTAVVVAVVAVPLVLSGGSPAGYAGEQMTVQQVETEGEAAVRPVVMESDEGNQIIWLAPAEEDLGGQADQKKRDKKDDQEDEEEFGRDPARTPAAADPSVKPSGGAL